MAIVKSDGSNGTWGTEFFLASASTSQTPQTTACILQLYIDTANIIAGDKYMAKFYETINGTQRVIQQFPIEGVQAFPPVFPSFIVMDGWEWSLTRSAGSDRTIKWSIRQVR